MVGDVHGCAEELLQLLRLGAADRVVLVGDLYTKGPDPAGVWRAVRDHGLAAVRGNHDQRLLDRLAGERPGDAHADAVIGALDADDPAWRDHLAATPLFLDVAGATVVHAGLHPSGDRSRTAPSVALNVRRLEHEGRRGPWWRLYEGPGPVVFGHDARQGLVRRERAGRPYVIGLDTGCVYGGALSGWLVEEDRLLQVPATACHRAV